MQLLNRKMLSSYTRSDVEIGPQESYPVKVMQMGEGIFMRAFIDWMIDKANSAGLFKGMVQIVEPREGMVCDLLNKQEGLYTLLRRGVEDGKATEYKRIITSVKGCLSPTKDWKAVVATATLPSLELIFSNTTEAGIDYVPEPYTPEVTQQSFPAKLCSLLFERFKAGLGGLTIVPCELIDHNGTTLRKYICKYAQDWNLGDKFLDYVNKDCNFLNTLVDRIVMGYPKDEAGEICQDLGYEDNLLICSELFSLFVIEGNESLKSVIPFEAAGLNVVWTQDQSAYRTRKVRFLNGGHTSSVLAAYLCGFDVVDQMTKSELFGDYLKKVLFDEVFVTIDLPEAEKTSFANSIIGRFLNPYAKHQLLSISLNSISKWQVRVLPSLLDYYKLKGVLPTALTFSLAALLNFYRGTLIDGVWQGKRGDESYTISDNAQQIAFINDTFKAYKDDKLMLAQTILANESFWGEDLSKIALFSKTLAEYLENIDKNGMESVVKSILK